MITRGKIRVLAANLWNTTTEVFKWTAKHFESFVFAGQRFHKVCSSVPLDLSDVCFCHLIVIALLQFYACLKRGRRSSVLLLPSQHVCRVRALTSSFATWCVLCKQALSVLLTLFFSEEAILKRLISETDINQQDLSRFLRVSCVKLKMIIDYSQSLSAVTNVI